MLTSQYYLIVILSIIIKTESARILGISSFPACSHQATLVPIWKELSLKGHQVTALVTDLLKDTTLMNLTEIDISNTYDVLKELNFVDNAGNHRSVFYRAPFVRFAIEKIMVAILENKDVKKLIADDNQKFDVILVEPHHPLVFAFAAKFQAPVVAISSLGVFLEIHDAIGNPTHPVISPDIFFNLEVGPSGPLFLDKLSSFLYNIWYRAYYYWILLPRADGIARQYFGNDMSYLGDLVQNVSLVLTNVNPVMHTIRPSVPKVVEIGQLHIKKQKKQLPTDLQEYLNKSKNGVIYFSLGTNVLLSKISEDTLKTIIETFSELPYDVICKWEADKFPIKIPKNVILKKWLPQQDLLGHSNLKLFIMQGGIQSIEEAIFSGVPMVGLPFMGDQTHNVQKMEDLGIGKGVNVKLLTKKSLKDTILHVIAENKSYRKNLLNVKSILEDQPMTGVDKAIWWIEYVIRHKGASHLQSPAATMSFYQYFIVDVILFIFFISFAILAFLIILFSLLVRSKTKKTKND